MNKVDELINRLENWKFQQAQGIAGNMRLTYKQREVVESLAKSFDNCGWFEGVMGELVGSIVHLICQELSEKYLDILDGEVE